MLLIILPAQQSSNGFPVMAMHCNFQDQTSKLSQFFYLSVQFFTLIIWQFEYDTAISTVVAQTLLAY